MKKTIEILQYTLHKGSGEVFHRIMCDISIPLHQRHGIDVVLSGRSLHDPDSYFLIRSFDSPESMSAVLDAFYASNDWRDGPRENIVGSIKTSIKTVISLPSESVEVLRG
ncbi:NIPSNAP family protein [Serratia marcescens]|nr:NIPSNAP family protein [Serratia marcescens]MBH2866156.1 NIPSNAP family protein [Serratia marcescens]MBW4239737.1 NIPSNAP family protein [Enterobacter roggenkampii]